MAIYHMRSRRKETGGLRHSLERCDKKLAWKGSEPTNTKLSDEEERETVRVRGGNIKVKLKKAAKAAVSIGSKTVVAPIKTILENSANREVARSNIITKGSLIEVELEGKPAKAVVTRRSGQHGVVQAKLLEEAKS